MKLGCGSVLFRQYDLERSLDAIRNIGYEYFETQAVGPWCPHVDVYNDDPVKLVALKNKFGFKGITGLWSLDGNIISNPNAVESGIRSIEFAAEAGIPVLHTGDGHKPEDMSNEYAFEVLQEKLSKILEVAKKTGVKVAIEPHGTFSLTKDGLLKILSLGSPDVLGVNYDACNIFRAGYVESGQGKSAYKNTGNGANEVDVLKAVSGRVLHMHAKDIDANGNCVSIGEGLVNVKDCISYLKSVGYQGVISLETEGNDTFEGAVELAKKSFETLNKYIKD